jgi:hypothetical protein
MFPTSLIAEAISNVYGKGGFGKSEMFPTILIIEAINSLPILELTQPCV